MKIRYRIGNKVRFNRYYLASLKHTHNKGQALWEGRITEILKGFSGKSVAARVVWINTMQDKPATVLLSLLEKLHGNKKTNV